MLTIPSLFARRRPEPVVCRHCGGPDPLEPDGGRVCYGCLLQFGFAAASPARLSYDTATALWSAHADVVRLVDTLDRQGRLTSRWHWFAGWPTGSEVTS